MVSAPGMGTFDWEDSCFQGQARDPHLMSVSLNNALLAHLLLIPHFVLWSYLGRILCNSLQETVIPSILPSIH